MRYLLSKLPAAPRNRLKALYFAGRREFIQRFLSYGSDELAATLRSLGIREGDSVMLHSSFALSGFRGSPKELVDVLLGVIGPSGNLMMVSLPYTGSTYDYVQKGSVFDVRKTPSQMGLISETFRRRREVRRSLHPTHPVLALGPRSEWIVAAHEACLYACGPGSPFEKLTELRGKIVFFNVPFRTMTFYHYLEHLVEKRLPFPLYLDQVFDVAAVDQRGVTTTVQARAFTPEASRRRRPELLFDRMKKAGRIGSARIGNSRLMAIEATDAVAITAETRQPELLFYSA